MSGGGAQSGWPWGGVDPSPGVLASDRLPRALAGAGLLIRPLSLPEAFHAAAQRLGVGRSAGLARRDPYASPWDRLFQQEPAWLFAQIISFNPDDAAFRLSEAQEHDPRIAARMVIDLAQLLQGWIQRMEFDTPGLFSKQLARLDTEIGLRKDLALLAGQSGDALLAALPAPALGDWPGDDSRRVLAAADQMGRALRTTHMRLRHAAAAFRPVAEAGFQQRITSGQMDPALGLLIAELRAARHVEAAMNRFPERHTRHYYDAIIGQQPLPAGPERVLLALGKSARPATLPAQARLEARLPDDGPSNDLLQVFATDMAAPVSTAGIGDIALLAYESDPHVSYHAALAGITGLRCARLPAEDAGGGDPQGRVFTQGIETACRMGLDISSPMLALAEGRRLIEMSLHLSRSSGLPAVSQPREGGGALAQSPDADPEIRLALSADPDLVAAFIPGKTETATETLTLAVTRLAAQRRITPSMSLIYEYLASLQPGLKALRLLLGRIATLCLIERAPFPSGEYWAGLAELIQRHRTQLIRTGDPAAEEGQGSMIFTQFSSGPGKGPDYPPEEVLQNLLCDAFEIRLGTAEGSVAPTAMQLLPIRAPRSNGGITFAMRLDEAAPPIVAPAPDQAPCLSLRLAANARICPLSFFERYAVDSIEFSVRVDGLRRMSGFSDSGPVSTDRTFAPFGARPGDGSSFQLGCPELAMKPVTWVGLSLTWDAMPEGPGGFASHYAAYPEAGGIPDPKLSVEYLGGDGWKPVGGGMAPLLQDAQGSGSEAAKRSRIWHHKGQIGGHSTAVRGPVRASEYRSRQTVRGGMIRLVLSQTAGDFKASQYPFALMTAMRPRPLPFDHRARPVPPAPFVPTVSALSLSYRAHGLIHVNNPESAGPGERIVQAGPFGRVELFPRRMSRPVSLFPQRLGYGQLAIQVTGQVTGVDGGASAPQPVALCFSMAASGHLRRVPEANPIRWFYLGPEGWKALPPMAILSDSTGGLMQSGLVMIDLPRDAGDHSPEMPAGGVWVAAIATRPDLGVFPRLRQIGVNGVWVQRLDQVWGGETTRREWSFVPPQPGLGKISEIAGQARVRPPETESDYRARLSERLRHRGRAVTPWDIERLLLHEFPEIWMVKCLPHLTCASPHPAPGHATVVTVAHPPGRDAPGAGPRPAVEPCLFDAASLERFHDFLASLAPHFAAFDVVNPGFERLQVRASVALAPGEGHGAAAQALRGELARYLSVWSAGPALARFGWSLNTRMLEAHIAGLPWVSRISDFSVLHLAADDAQSHELLDTGQGAGDPRGLYGPIIRPRRPWSLPLPASCHVLNIRPRIEEEDPTASGIGSLPVGDMLIVSQRTQP